MKLHVQPRSTRCSLTEAPSPSSFPCHLCIRLFAHQVWRGWVPLHEEARCQRIRHAAAVGKLSHNPCLAARWVWGMRAGRISFSMRASHSPLPLQAPATLLAAFARPPPDSLEAGLQD